MTSSTTHRPSVKRAKIHFHSACSTSLLDVRRAMKALSGELRSAGVPQLQRSYAEIVVAELLNNIVKHAQHRIEHGWFDLQFCWHKHALHFTCRDNGSAMPGGQPPTGIFPTLINAHADLPEGGWGWALIRALTTDLTYRRSEGINFVSFNIPFKATRKH